MKITIPLGKFGGKEVLVKKEVGYQAKAIINIDTSIDERLYEISIEEIQRYFGGRIKAISLCLGPAFLHFEITLDDRSHVDIAADFDFTTGGNSYLIPTKQFVPLSNPKHLSKRKWVDQKTGSVKIPLFVSQTEKVGAKAG